MQLTLVTPPSIEPVTVAEAKLHCKVDTGADDTLITALITSAREYCERYTKRAFITQTWELSLDASDWHYNRRYLYLPLGNVQSITSVTSYQADNTPIVYDASSYRHDNTRILLNNGYLWPELYREFGALEVIYTAGYGSAEDKVPNAIKQAMLMLIALHYKSREEANADAGHTEIVPFGITALLQPYKIFVL